MLRRALAALSLLALGACTPRTIQFADGGLDAGVADGPAGEAPGPLALDLAVTGCARYDVGGAKCTGTPPLVLSFAPVGSPTLTRFVWSFGDGTPNSVERGPTHTYALPGAYDVSLVAEGPAGSVSRTRAKLVEVMALGAGAGCDVDAQCGGELRCRCMNGSCGPAFARGLCTEACPSTGCGDGATCAAFVLPTPAATPPAPDAAVPARDAAVADAPVAGDGAADVAAADATGLSDGAVDAASLGGPVDAADASTPAGTSCLAACMADAECAPGLACRSVPSGGAGAPARWVKACLPSAFQELGAPCRDEHGALDDGACASGVCADLGALGACSAACGAASPCPSGSACATFGNGRALCVATCGGAAACARDPLLRCEPAGAAGALGFEASPPAVGAIYCAPRTCATSGDCGPAGLCTPLGVGAHCARP
jgi:PKD repeat protein